MKDKFLSDPNNLKYKIVCISCRLPLWETKILKRSGDRVVSSESHPCHPNAMKFDRKIEKCPICKKRFYGVNKTGQCYLILDMNSGIQRLI